MTLNEMQKAIHENAKLKGFYENPKNTGEMIALMHSELSEALEADRKGKYCEANMNGVNGWIDPVHFSANYNTHVKGTLEEEMADIIIRVLDFCEYRGIPIEDHIVAKMRYNSLREHKHGKNY